MTQEGAILLNKKNNTIKNKARSWLLCVLEYKQKLFLNFSIVIKKFLSLIGDW